MTIHITPEPEFSYVSFESNVAAASYSDLIARVIDTFKPGKFVVTVFANKTSPAFGASREFEHVDSMGEFKRKDIQYCRFDSYDLTYALYVKYPSWGLKCIPCVGAADTTWHSQPPPPSSATPSRVSYNTNNNNTVPVKFLMKLLHFFSLSSFLQSSPSADKATTTQASPNQQSQQPESELSSLPQLAYTTAMIFFIQLFSVIFVLNIDELSSPLVMFSYWRNKISWNWFWLAMI